MMVWTYLSTGSLIKVTSKASGTDAGNNGLIKVIANDMSDGKGLVIETQKLSKGTGIEMINNEKLTSGKLLNFENNVKIST